MKTNDIDQSTAEAAFNLTEQLLGSESLLSTATPSSQEAAAVAGNMVAILSSLSNVVATQSENRGNYSGGNRKEAKVNLEPVRLRLADVADVLCRAVTDNSVPDSLGLHTASDLLGIRCQKKVVSVHRQAIRTEQAVSGPSFNFQWRPQAGQDIAARSTFVASALLADPTVTLPLGATPGATQLGSEMGQSRRFLSTEPEPKVKLEELRLQVPDEQNENGPLRVTLVSNKHLVANSSFCEIRGAVDSVPNGVMYGGDDGQSFHSVFHSVFIDFVAGQQRRFYKAEKHCADLLVGGGVTTTPPPGKSFFECVNLSSSRAGPSPSPVRNQPD